jgi:nicotinate-nucleotide adenylyltransferase
MLKLALQGEPRYSLDDADLRSGEPVFTVHTLSRLRTELGGSLPLVFLIGADQLLALDTWREWKRLFELAHFGVAERPGFPITPSSLPPAVAEELRRRKAGAAQLARSSSGSIAVFPMTPLEISATGVREAIARGEPPADALPKAVLDYIASKHLYWTRQQRTENTRK